MQNCRFINNKLQKRSFFILFYYCWDGWFARPSGDTFKIPNHINLKIIWMNGINKLYLSKIKYCDFGLLMKIVSFASKLNIAY